MADVTEDRDADHAAALGRRYLIRFEEDTLRQRPLWIRLIIAGDHLPTLTPGPGEQVQASCDLGAGDGAPVLARS